MLKGVKNSAYALYTKGIEALLGKTGAVNASPPFATAWSRTKADKCPAHEAASILEEMNAFGAIVVNEQTDLTGQLETKAITVAAYGGAILGFLVLNTTVALSVPEQIFLAIGMVLAIVATISGFLAVYVKGRDAFSDGDWVPPNVEHVNDLKAVHFRALYEYSTALKTDNLKKGRCVLVGQWALFFALASVAIALSAQKLSLF